MVVERCLPATHDRAHAVQYRDPTLSEALADPLVQAVMRADNVDPRELKALLSGLMLVRARRGSPPEREF